MKTKTTSSQNRRIAAINAAAHRTNVEAAAAADRHARSFSEMFAIDSSIDSLTPTAQYLDDLVVVVKGDGQVH
jgi:hypothetical protein